MSRDHYFNDNRDIILNIQPFTRHAMFKLSLCSSDSLSSVNLEYLLYSNSPFSLCHMWPMINISKRVYMQIRQYQRL